MSVFLRWLGLGGGLLTLAAIAFLSSQSLHRVRTDTAWVDHTHQVLASIARVRLLVTEAASSRRGLVTTGNRIERDGYVSAQNQIDRELADLTQLVRDNPVEVANAEKFAPLIGPWRSLLDASIAAQDRDGFVFQEQNDYAERARSLATGIHNLARRMEEEEEHLLAARQRDARASAQRARRIVIGGNALGLLLLIGAASASAREIRARHRADAVLQHQVELLKQSEERANLALDSAQMGSWDLDLIDDRAVRSLKHDQIFGYPSLPPEWSPAIFLTHVLPEDRELAKERFQVAFATGQFDLECRIVWPDHSVHWISAQGHVYRNEKGDPVRMMGVVRDVSERKGAEQVLAERSAELEAANQELESFSYSVSHDLRAPLRAIDGFSQALLEESGDRLDESGKRYLGKVRAAAQRMAQLIDDMLSLAQVSRKTLERESVDLGEIAAEVFAVLARDEPNRKVSFEVAHQVKAEADEGLLRIALQNLIGNAWKFTARREDATIEFGVRNDSGEPRYFVRDNGAGFDMAYAGKLFGAFHRLHTESDFSGTGIGLATVARIVHRHGGRVWAEGRVGEGATFWFTL